MIWCSIWNTPLGFHMFSFGFIDHKVSLRGVFLDIQWKESWKGTRPFLAHTYENPTPSETVCSSTGRSPLLHGSTLNVNSSQPGCFTNCRRETVEKDVPPGYRRGLDLRRTWTVRRRVRHPRTPGRTILSAVAAGHSWNIRAKTKCWR